MIGRLLWIAFLGAAAIQTSQLQLDREGLREAGWGDWVAAPFRGYTQEAVARDAILADDPEAALIEARRLVLRRPVPAENLTLLARAYAAAGNMEAANATFSEAARRGWREPFAQQEQAAIALKAGDQSEAARRFIALMIIANESDETLGPLAAATFTDPDGPAVTTVAQMLSETDRWHNAFVRRGAAVMPPEAFAAVISTSAERGVRFDCTLLERAARIVKRTKPDGAEAAAIVAGVRCT